jgi:EpsI family protein
MIGRRNLLAGLGCLGAVGTAEFLRPRRKIVLMPEGAKLTDIVPATFAGWSSGEGGDIVVPRTEGSLASTLYSDQLARSYHDTVATDPEVMVLVAYGAAQSDLLQLHRPEVCYPAIGFEIIDRRFMDIGKGNRRIPAVGLTARAGSRVEDIVYWTRLGDALPRTASEQRADRLESAMQGYIGDGVLFRASAARTSDEPLFGQLTGFLEALVTSLRPEARVALLGRKLAAA